MNPARRIHTLTQVTQTTRSTNSTTGIESAAETLVLTNVRCRIRPVGPKQFDSLIGRGVQAVFAVEWGAEDIRDGDTALFEGKNYAVREVRSLTINGALTKTQVAVMVELARKQHA
jgi:hypothetical protein